MLLRYTDNARLFASRETVQVLVQMCAETRYDSRVPLSWTVESFRTEQQKETWSGARMATLFGGMVLSGLLVLRLTGHEPQARGVSCHRKGYDAGAGLTYPMASVHWESPWRRPGSKSAHRRFVHSMSQTR